jgi:very-short-patch-repair endonuclease
MRRTRLSAHQRSVVSGRALAMRHAPTLTEALLWGALRARQLGVTFRRQVVLGRFIADFAASECRLVVEVDGGYHAHTVARDARRDRDLAKLGYRVVRVPADLVLQDLAAAVALVRAAVG